MGSACSSSPSRRNYRLHTQGMFIPVNSTASGSGALQTPPPVLQQPPLGLPPQQSRQRTVAITRRARLYAHVLAVYGFHSCTMRWAVSSCGGAEHRRRFAQVQWMGHTLAENPPCPSALYAAFKRGIRFTWRAWKQMFAREILPLMKGE